MDFKCFIISLCVTLLAIIQLKNVNGIDNPWTPVSNSSGVVPCPCNLTLCLRNDSICSTCRDKCIDGEVISDGSWWCDKPKMCYDKEKLNLCCIPKVCPDIPPEQ
ncbi:Hypothetical protein CINCED_3A023753 [Cinara cedri]|uniref:Uncharacterized protein n=1 Tax=Cinara cedri TaxID=506608 RepID=A0A5E4MBD4_9HEMI|nr:Hypothetical protein CINCED_3A023753 [Cinara cedri]